MTKLLVIDDNARDHDRVHNFLRDTGFEVVAVVRGAEALPIVAAASPPVQLVILLWELPGEPSGVQLLTELRRDYIKIPVIVVSGLLDLSRAAAAHALGAKDFLMKPLQRARLLAAIDAAVQPEPESVLLHRLRSTMKGDSAKFLAALSSLARIIPRSEDNVLLVGESGTGKELAAKAIHDLGTRSTFAWVPVNMAAIQISLLESQLFGHSKGAFTDAKMEHKGYFDEVGGGVLFLDEIGELDLSIQAKLLRAIESRRFRPVGGDRDKEFHGRLVCATNRNLAEEVKAGRFRADLYFRIATHEVRLPPLRERPEDVRLLAEDFLSKAPEAQRKRLAFETKAIIGAYRFPGNVRELEDVLSHAISNCDGEEILPYHLPLRTMQDRETRESGVTALESLDWPELLFLTDQREALRTIEQAFNRVYLLRKLEETGHNVERAAKLCGWKDDKTFRQKWDQAGLPSLTKGK